jgi:RNA polymerase sigma factor (TIGR02999 family)
MAEVTRILQSIEDGDPLAAEQLLPLVYDELRKLAAARMAHEKPGQTLQATALVHDAYLRLVDVDKARHWNSRGHFFAAAAEAMRRILVDHVRSKRAWKRGGRVDFERLDERATIVKSDPDEILAVHEQLDKLQAEDELAATLVKLRYFAGLPIEQAAEVLGLSRATAYRTWTYARAWLRASLSESDESG